MDIINQEEQDRIINQFKTLADNSNYKTTSKAFKNAEVAFFVGVHTILKEKTPPIWLMCISSGRSIWKTINDIKNKKKEEPKILMPVKIKMFIKFKGIDDFGRPIYKHINSNTYFGSTITLFDYGVNIEDIDKYFKHNLQELEYFGESFNCEPYGGNNDKYEFIIIE